MRGYRRAPKLNSTLLYASQLSSVMLSEELSRLAIVQYFGLCK